MTTYAKGGFVRFSRPGRFGFASPAATAMLLACVLASVGCDRAESPFAPDFGVEEPSRLSVPVERTPVAQPPAEPPEAEPALTEEVPTPATDTPPLEDGKESAVRSAPPGDPPGEDESIVLRGPTSISTECRSVSPLIIIDGVKQPDDFKLSDGEALDIDHVEVVKGRAAILLYGPRARGGAIDIQTKRGAQAAILNGLKPR
ncbi:TonB-dependent receptor plug domain-containing protein [Candidatus Palauibacter polyketidifaciens]|uniref:TonB-dependent receptor n=1 Tax=Candidatus Palauibacter polyketidifaciens TaxID=3056740 RepID=UPI0023937BA3|nr:TonB-dependent receptor plug domain-containing protein [Candidatus Palauibacter polyketidifaciens]MDE2719264.1 TonB-dependent receptor plug domain-containing protein [Candidatus Palauibacter polyketidifaciens]